jgi:PAS domain S-box-containing protein
MWMGLRQWLHNVPVADPIEYRQARLVQVILLGLSGVLLFAALLTLVAFPFTSGAIAAANLRNSISNVIGLIFLLVPLILLRRGNFRTAVAILMVELYLLAYTTFSEVGLEQGWIGVLELALPMSLAGLALSRRWLVAVYLASIAGVAATALAFYPMSGLPQNAPSVIIAFALIAGLLALFLDRFGAAFRASLAALRESEERYRLIADNAIDLISLIDHADRVTYASPSYQSVLGYPPARLTEHPASDIVHPDDRDRWLSQRGRAPALFRCRHADGTWRWLEGTRSLVAQGDRSYQLVVSRDVTERVAAEQALQHAHTELEQRVRDRTIELEAANKELEAFSYSVSHDLRAPLRAIDGYSRIVLEDYSAELPSEGQRYLQRLRENTKRMGNLIDDLLGFAQLSRLPLSRQPVALAHLAREALDELSGDYAGRQVEIQIAELPDCLGDPALLKQVLVNLLGNAIKYTRSREAARIELSYKAGDAETVYLVRDNGVGFDMRYSDKLFGVFQRMHRAEDYEGTGVGLAIVQRIIHRHGGRVWAEAEVGHGATFYFTLPAA